MNLNGSAPQNLAPDSAPGAPPEQEKDLSLWARLGVLIKDNFQERPFVSWLAVAAVVLVLYLRVMLPLIDWASETRQNAATLAKSLAGLEAMAEREEARLKKLQGDHQRLEKLAATLPEAKTDKAQNKLAGDARKLAESQGLKVINSLILAPKPQGSLQRLALNLTADGSYEQMRAFLAAFAKTPDFMAPASFSIAPSPESVGQLRMECEVVTLLRRKP